MGEAIVIEQFCHVVGAETQGWIRCDNPDTLEQAVKLAEDFEDSLTSAQIGLLIPPTQLSLSSPPPLSAPPPPGPGQRPPRPPAPMGNLASPPWRPRSAPSWGSAAPAPLPCQQRDRCHQPGHQTKSCASAMECDVAACNLASEEGKHGENPQGQVAISCIHGDTATYPTVKAYLSVSPIKRHLILGVVERLPYPIILGRDWPNYRELVKLMAVLTTHVNVAEKDEAEMIGNVFPFQTEMFSPLFRPRKTNKERRMRKWEGALMRQGWGLVGACYNGNKRQSKGVGTQCDREGEVTGPSRADVTPAPLNIPDMWHSSADIASRDAFRTSPQFILRRVRVRVRVRGNEDPSPRPEVPGSSLEGYISPGYTHQGWTGHTIATRFELSQGSLQANWNDNCLCSLCNYRVLEGVVPLDFIVVEGGVPLPLLNTFQHYITHNQIQTKGNPEAQRRWHGLG
ncbi:unnamed protein product [Leuciscus chuanchicus]